MSGMKIVGAMAVCAIMVGCATGPEQTTTPGGKTSASAASAAVGTGNGPTSMPAVTVAAPVTPAAHAATINVSPLPVPSGTAFAVPAPAAVKTGSAGTIPFQPISDKNSPTAAKVPDKKPEDPRQLEKRVLYQYQMESPAKYDALMRLRRQNPVQYRVEVQKLMAEQQKKLEEFMQMIAAYKRTPNPTLKAGLKARIAEVYDRQIRWERNKVERLEAELKKQREEYRKHLEKRDRAIEDQLGRCLLLRAQQW